MPATMTKAAPTLMMSLVLLNAAETLDVAFSRRCNSIVYFSIAARGSSENQGLVNKATSPRIVRKQVSPRDREGLLLAVWRRCGEHLLLEGRLDVEEEICGERVGVRCKVHHVERGRKRERGKDGGRGKEKRSKRSE